MEVVRVRYSVKTITFSGGFEEFFQKLSEHKDEITYSYLRFRYSEKQTRTKYVKITMISDTVPMFARAKANTHKPSVEGYFQVLKPYLLLIW